MAPTRSQNRVSRFLQRNEVLRNEVGLRLARASFLDIGPIQVPASKNFMLRRLTTGPRSCSRMHSFETSHANRNVRSQSSWWSIMSVSSRRLRAAAKRRTLFDFRFSIFVTHFGIRYE